MFIDDDEKMREFYRLNEEAYWKVDVKPQEKIKKFALCL